MPNDNPKLGRSNSNPTFPTGPQPSLINNNVNLNNSNIPHSNNAANQMINSHIPNNNSNVMQIESNSKQSNFNSIPSNSNFSMQSMNLEQPKSVPGPHTQPMSVGINIPPQPGPNNQNIQVMAPHSIF